VRKPKSISDDTKRAILEAAWDLITEAGTAEVAMAEVAKRAGVSRQTIFYAFGGRPGVLLAMVRHKDTETDHVARLGAIVARPDPGPEALVAYSEVWLDYLPIIYPVGILLDAASLNDAEAAAAWNDRMVGALLRGYRHLAQTVHSSHGLPAPPDRVAETIWALVHPTAYRRLVEDCGWSPDEFRSRQLELIGLLAGSPETGSEQQD
jgi:AcrR family transcriptional regulator